MSSPPALSLSPALVFTVLHNLHASPHVFIVPTFIVAVATTLSHPGLVVIILIRIFICDTVPDNTGRYCFHVHLLQHRPLLVLRLACLGRRGVRTVHASVAIE